jgi:hypothetical protein
MAQSIDDIGSSVNTALAALDTAIDALSDQITQTPDGPVFKQLMARHDDLVDEKNALLAAATAAVLALPQVVAAAATLNTLAKQMNTAAQKLPAATKVVDVLAGSTTVLSSAQRFGNTLATAQQS